MTLLKSDLSDDKTRAIIHCNLLSISWQNLKNSEEKLASILKTMNSKSLKSVLQTFFKDFNDFNVIQEGTNSILKEIDREIQQINDTLRDYNAPLNIINSEIIKPKFDFIMKLFQTDLEKLKQVKGDLEDRLTSLQNENHQIHAEFKDYMNRQQSQKDNSDSSVDEEFLLLKQRIETFDQRFADSENENLFLRCTIEELNQQISQLIPGKDGKNQNLQMEELHQNMSVLNIKFEAKNQQLLIVQEMLDRKEKEFESKLKNLHTENSELKTIIDGKTNEIKALQNTIEDMSFKNNEIQYELDIEKELNAKASQEIECHKEKEIHGNGHGTLRDSLNGYDETNCKHRSQIKKLTHDLAKLSDRYSEKRERHRHKLMEARTMYHDKIQNLTDQENDIKCAFSDISEKLRMTQLNLKSVTNDKMTLVTENIKLENEIRNCRNEVTLFHEKISQLEKQIVWMKVELLPTNIVTIN